MTEQSVLQTFDAGQVAAALPYAALIEALRLGLQEQAHVPPRSVQAVPVGLVATMPVWGVRHGAVKIATVVPGNAAVGLPTIHAQVLIFDGAAGVPVALIDGTELTLRRTAAISALASSYLARPEAASLLIVGTGALAPHLALAHAAVRRLSRITIWGRSRERAESVAAKVSADLPGIDVLATSDPRVAAAQADLISSATSASEPVLRGAWLKPGTHVDLVGSFSPDAREADDEVVRGARIFVDTRIGTMAEAGDLVIPIDSGVLNRDCIIGELADLCRGSISGRTTSAETTVFKAVGTAFADLIAAERVVAGASATPT